jgi:hypothetical protein
MEEAHDHGNTANEHDWLLVCTLLTTAVCLTHHVTGRGRSTLSSVWRSLLLLIRVLRMQLQHVPEEEV